MGKRKKREQWRHLLLPLFSLRILPWTPYRYHLKRGQSRQKQKNKKQKKTKKTKGKRGSSGDISYFHCSLFGYFLGLLTATISSEVSRGKNKKTKNKKKQKRQKEKEGAVETSPTSTVLSSDTSLDSLPLPSQA